MYQYIRINTTVTLSELPRRIASLATFLHAFSYLTSTSSIESSWNEKKDKGRNCFKIES